MIVELPNGQELEFPDGTAPEVMRNAIHKNFPEYQAMYKENTQDSPEKSSDKENILRYGIKDPLIGALNFGSRGATSAGNLAIGLINKLGGNLPKQKESDFSEMLGIPEEKKNLADKLIQFAPEVAISLAAPATRLGKVGDILERLPGWGKYLKSGLGNALSQGAIAASQSPENQGESALEAGAVTAPFSALSEAVKSGNPTIRNIGRVLGGLGVGGLGYYGAKSIGAPEPAADLSALLGASLGGRGGNTVSRVAKDVLKGVEGTPYQESLDAAKRLGLTYITPAEASGNPFTGGVQGSLGKTEKGAQLLYERGKKRATSEENAIENLFGNIFPKKLEERKNSLYKSAEPIKIPEKELADIKENDIYKDALKEVKNDVAYRQKLKGVPENSIQYLNQVKKKMDDMIAESPKDRGNIIKDTKNELTAISDKVSPEYKEARQLAERGIVRKEIEDLFNKKDETGTNLFKTLLSNKRDYSELQSRFKRLQETSTSPEQIKGMKTAQQQLEDMKLIFGRLINIPTAKTAEALARGSMSKERSTMQAATQKLREILSGGKYDKAAVELITNPEWAKSLNNLNKITKKDKLIGSLYNLLGKAGGQAVAQ